jgi:hypothetical protein
MHPIITLLATAMTLALLPFSQSRGFYDWNGEEGPLDEETDRDNPRQDDEFTDG